MEDLTPKEREVLAKVIEGCQNQEIAASMGVSIETVKTHVLHLRQKLNAKNRPHLVSRAFEQGVVHGGSV